VPPLGFRADELLLPPLPLPRPLPADGFPLAVAEDLVADVADGRVSDPAPVDVRREEGRVEAADRGVVGEGLGGDLEAVAEEGLRDERAVARGEVGG